jgi:hypothetical protein
VFNIFHSIFHVALQTGSFLACAAAFHRKSFLEEVASQDSDVLRLYSLFLIDKVVFHNTYRVSVVLVVFSS